MRSLGISRCSRPFGGSSGAPSRSPSCTGAPTPPDGLRDAPSSSSTSPAARQEAAACSKESDGEYTISFEFLPADADAQREQLVRRLGAEDDSIDIIGMDVIWTAEFANAGWLLPVGGRSPSSVTEDVFDSVVESASFEGELYAAPFRSNTQLLWYRKDLVDKPPRPGTR